MFKINYKAFKNNEIEADELNGEYGYFQFDVDQESYGILIPQEIEEFSVSIYDWFSNFIEALLILENNNYALISDIEKIDIWIELKKEDNSLKISKVSSGKIEVGGVILKEKLPDTKYLNWKEKEVSFMEFKSELLEKAQSCIEEIKELNNPGNKYLEELKSKFNEC